MLSHKIQITIDPEFDILLKKMKLRFPLMKEVDLLRMATSGFYSQNRQLFEMDVEFLSDEDSEIVEQSKLELSTKTPKTKTFTTGKDLINFAKASTKTPVLVKK